MFLLSIGDFMFLGRRKSQISASQALSLQIDVLSDVNCYPKHLFCQFASQFCIFSVTRYLPKNPFRYAVISDKKTSLCQQSNSAFIAMHNRLRLMPRLRFQSNT